MRRALFLVLLLVCVPVMAAAETAFVNVNVVPMSSDTVLEQQTVVVSNGVIAAVGPVDEVPIPKGAAVVDGTDRFLMPGLAEMHAHVPEASSPNVDRFFTLYLANGVTTIRGMLGQPSHIRLRANLESGEVVGPRLVTSGPSVNGRSVNGVESARGLVERQHEIGYDFIKVHPGPDAEEFAAMATTANRLDMPFAGHVPTAVGVRSALEQGIATIDHLDGYFAAMLPPSSHGRGGFGGFFDVFLADEIDASQIPELVQATKEAGTWNVPTQTLVEQLINDVPVEELRNRPEMHYMPKGVVDQWAATKESQLADRDYDAEVAAKAIALRRQLILEMQRAGAGLLLGSDSPQIFNVPGFSLHRELDLMVAAGLTPYEALYSGTAAVAEFFGSNTGIIAIGRDADLVLLDANPLEDIRNSRRIHGVMLRGVWHSGASLEEQLSRIRVW